MAATPVPSGGSSAFKVVFISAAATCALAVGYEYAAFQALGNYVQWPATQWCTSSYDPRFRPWYVSAASGPKDIVIVLDVSGSMDGNGRLKLLKEVRGRTHTQHAAAQPHSHTAAQPHSHKAAHQSISSVRYLAIVHRCANRCCNAYGYCTVKLIIRRGAKPQGV